MSSRREYHYHLFGYRLEIGAEMNRAFERQDFLIFGFDANVPEQSRIVGLHAFAADNNAHFVNGEERHPSQFQHRHATARR
jgi:hypothetical protein